MDVVPGLSVIVKSSQWTLKSPTGPSEVHTGIAGHFLQDMQDRAVLPLFPGTASWT